MKYYIAVRMKIVGELYDVSGPYDSYDDAEDELWIYEIAYGDIIEEDQYLAIVPREE